MIEETKKKLSSEQIRNVEILADKISGLNFYQAAYQDLLLEENAVKNKKTTHLYANTNWAKIVQMDSCPPVNPAYFKQQEFMADFTKWLSSVKPIDLGFGTVATASQASQVKIEEKADDSKKIKSVVDIELSSFDTAKKIVLIKEVRSILNLGLKEVI
jgi:large subunit ribosomal protein L7/L12